MHLSRISSRNLLLWAIAVNLFLSLSLGAIAYLVDYPINNGFLAFKSPLEKFVLAVLAAPFLETLLYQYFLVGIMQRLSIRMPILERCGMVLILPSALFALSHDYNTGYMLTAFVMGLSFNSYYLIMKKRGNWAVPLTMLVHSLNNLFVFSLQELSHWK